LRGGIVAAAIGVIGSGFAVFRTRPLSADTTPSFPFQELGISRGEDIAVAPGYEAQVLLPWGSELDPEAPSFDPAAQTSAAQLRQVGYNHDFLGFIPLPAGSRSSDHGLLCVNHEFTTAPLMFPEAAGLSDKTDPPFENLTEELAAIEMAAHGGTIAEIRKEGDQWALVDDSRYNRRITARDTQLDISGPASGNDRLKTTADPSGTRVIGTIGNCAGGITPWGTYLMAEENFNLYFLGELQADHRETKNYQSLRIPGARYGWGRHLSRFDVGKEPNEANRFGWIVEVDALDPNSTPVKRTALGLFKHEGAETIVNKDGRIVVYMGDDSQHEYLYRFVTDDPVNIDDRKSNRNLLDDGTLFVARFASDGTMDWLPMIWGAGPLTSDNGFDSQADVLIEARRAAKFLDATTMDRPEDVQPNAITGKVYVSLTNNTSRDEDDTNAANPRGPNPHGHIIEMTPPNNDHAAPTFQWDILVQCGRMSKRRDRATFHRNTSAAGLFAKPDNLAVDPNGRLWVATDGNSPKSPLECNDGIWAIETNGDARATAKHFFSGPLGAEICGPRFTPDGRTLFVSVQHPAAGDDRSTFSHPRTRWPDFDPDMPPRPAVVAITKLDGGMVGS
jgi:secreted PhoX family phosphatase